MSGAPANVVYARLGAYVNVLGPIALYVLLLRLLGRTPALYALLAYLFSSFGRDFPPPYAATYAPWLYASYLAQVPFYAGLAALAEALRRDRLVWYAATGALLGLTFLAHTFPALLLGGSLLLAPAGAFRNAKGAHDARRLHACAGFALALAVAFATSLPFTLTILLRYHLAVVNPEPTTWIPEAMRELPRFLLLHGSPAALIALLGVGTLVVRRAQLGARLLLVWLGLVLAWLLYVTSWDALEGADIPLPKLLFSMHVGLYFRVLLAVCFGVGLDAAVGWVLRRWPGLGQRHLGARAPLLLPLLPALLIVALALPGYGARSAFEKARELSQARAARVEQAGLVAWIRENTDPSDVFLTDDRHGLYTVVAAGRKIVATWPMHSNPYVDIQRRRADRDRLQAALARGRFEDFFALAARYDVAYVLVERPLPALAAAPPGTIALRHATSHGVVYAIRRDE